MPATRDPKTNIHNLAHGAHHGERVKKFGKKKAHRVEVAAAFSEARRAKKRSKVGRKK